jgi:class 3 adenylate cyclase/tetratricopeptide (TPR) repeat protein
MAAPAAATDVLVPYVPRLLLGWLAESPGELLREVDGSMVFVDISGFTKMSEQLAKKGKIGAEEVTDVISSVFARLLAVAYGNGGGLIKFGGDALLLLFDGDAHELRAARAAVGMRRTLREIGRVRTSGGSVTLRMSVGVHTGRFQFCLVGGSHRELIVTGPAASETVLMENTADAGEILVSPALAERLPRSVLGAPKEDGILLRAAPPGLERHEAAALPPVAPELLVGCVPVALRGHLLAGLDEPEHRHVVVAFLHFDGADELVEHRGADALATALDELVRTVQEHADAQGVTFLGSDIDRDGGKILLVAGAPQALGDDEERMLLALRGIAEAGSSLPLKIGANLGHIFSGAVGPPYRRTYTVMGDAVNLAARVMSKARHGQVLATATLLDASAIGFRTTPLEPFHVKGKTEPVVAAEVGEPLGAREAAASLELPLVGRGEELGTLADAVAALARGGGRLLEIVGPPGIGKTRLLAELKALAANAHVVSTACDLYSASTAYQPFRRVLERLLGLAPAAPRAEAAEALARRVRAEAPQLEPWVPLLGVPLDLELPPTREVLELGEEFRRERLHEAVVELLAGLVPGPLVLTVEDVHWMDEASCGLLARIALETRHRPWLVGVTRRDEATGFVAADGPTTATIRPRPLGVTEAEVLVVAASDDAPFRPHELEALAQRGGGNPLFLLELVQAARAAGTVEGLPTSVESMVTAEIDRLPAELRRVLRRAAVLGMSFREETLATLSEEGEEPPGAALAGDRLGGFLVLDEDGSWRFRHALVRDAAYHGLPFRQRRALHARAGEQLARRAASPEEVAELLSLHFFHAGRFAEAWRYSRTAGERAVAKYANAEAAELYGRALEAAREARTIAPEEVAGVYEARGDALEKTGAFEEAMASYRNARRRLDGDVLGEARLYRKEGEVAEELALYPQAIRILQRGLRLIADLPEAPAAGERAHLALMIGLCCQRQGKLARARRWCRRAIEEAERSGDREALAWAFLVLDAVNIAAGRLDAVEYAERALAVYEELGRLDRQAGILNNLGVRAWVAGSWNEALELYERARELHARAGDSVARADGTFNVAEVLVMQGRLAEAEPLLQEASRVWRAAGDRLGVAQAACELGRVASRGGRYDEALALLAEARQEFARLGAADQVVETDQRIAECRLVQGDAEGALRVADEALAAAAALGDAGEVRVPALARVRGCALAALGRHDDAQVALDAAIGAAREAGAEYELALALLALGRAIGGQDTAAQAALCGEAEGILARLGVVAPPVLLPGSTR